MIQIQINGEKKTQINSLTEGLNACLGFRWHVTQKYLTNKTGCAQFAVKKKLLWSEVRCANLQLTTTINVALVKKVAASV